MKQSGSYDVSSFATSLDTEIRRLNAQVDLFWSLEYPLYQRYGLRDGMDVLDCGCGPGRLIELLKEKMPGLRCTGLEMDPVLVKAASRLFAERGLKGCRVVQGTAEKPGLDENSFDFIIMRIVLEHVPDPVLALRSLRRLLKAKGRIVLIDNDFDFHLRTWPPVPQLDRLYEAYRASRRKDGGDPCIGRRLPRHLAEAGMGVAGYEVEIAHSALLGDNPFLRAEGAGIPAQLVHSGFLDAGTLEDMTRTWRAMLLEPGHSIVRPLFVAVGEKTARPSSGVAAPDTDASRKPAAETGGAGAEGPAGPGGTLAMLQAVAAEIFKDKLKEAGKKRVEPGDSLVDLGMDSLSALDLQEKIKDSTGTLVPLEKILDNIPLTDLAKHVDKASAGKAPGPETADASSGKKKPKAWEEGEI